MKKNIIAGLLLTTFITMNTLPACAFIHLGAQKDNLSSDNQKVENTKTQKPKKTKWTQLKVKDKYDFINLGWWEAMDDEYLNEYIQKAVEHNYSLKIASLTVDEYYHNVRLQMSNEFPTITAGVSPGVGGTKNSSKFNMFVPILVNYEADIFLKNHDKTKSVKKIYEATIQDERAAYISVVSAVGTTYFNIVKLDKLIENQKQIVNLRQEIYDAMLLSNKEGIASTFEVVKANKALIAGQTQLVDLEKARINALNQLAVLIGESPMNIENLQRSSYEKLKYKYDMPKEISSEIITQRPDYIKSEIMLQKAGIDVRVAKKEFLPCINIGGLALFNTINGNQSLLTSFAWGAGGQIVESISLGGVRIANLKLNKVKYEKMLKVYQQTNLTSIQEINDAMYAYKFSNDKYIQNLNSLKLEIKDFNLSDKKYNEGVISKLDLNQHRENLLVIHNLVVQNKIACLVDSIGLYKATGAGVNKTKRLGF